MNEIIKYLEDAFGGAKLTFYIILLALIAAGLIVTFVLAASAQIKKRKKSALTQEFRTEESSGARTTDGEDKNPNDFIEPADEFIETPDAEREKDTGEIHGASDEEQNADSFDAEEIAENGYSESDAENAETYSVKKSNYRKPKAVLVYKNAGKPDERAVTEEQPAADEKTSTLKSNYNGKWVIECEDVNYVAKLKASNGDLLLTSSEYTSLSGVKSAITTIKKNLADGNAAVTVNADGKFIFKVLSSSGKTLCVSEAYNARYQCEKALVSAERFSKTAIIAERE